MRRRQDHRGLGPDHAHRDHHRGLGLARRHRGPGPVVDLLVAP